MQSSDIVEFVNGGCQEDGRKVREILLKANYHHHHPTFFWDYAVQYTY